MQTGAQVRMFGNRFSAHVFNKLCFIPWMKPIYRVVLPLPLRLPTQLGLLARSEIATDELALPKEPTDLGYWARSQGVLGHLSAGWLVWWHQFLSIKYEVPTIKHYVPHSRMSREQIGVLLVRFFQQLPSLESTSMTCAPNDVPGIRLMRILHRMFFLQNGFL